MSDSYEEDAFLSGGKRCGLAWTPWMGDWFVSWSPRNWNNHAEGPWDHWVDLALRILNDPMTKTVRPEVYDAEYRGKNFYDETARGLTDEELGERFKEAPGDH